MAVILAHLASGHVGLFGWQSRWPIGLAVTGLFGWQSLWPILPEDILDYLADGS